MKVLNCLTPKDKEIQRIQSIDTEIRRLCQMEGCEHFDSEQIVKLDQAAKVQWVSVLQTMEISLSIRAAAREQTRVRKEGFHFFGLLPTELRLKIWIFAMETHMRSRVHCLHKKQGKFVSNHGISPLLHTSSESRWTYFGTTNGSFAFETYINFDTDVIYLPYMAAIERVDPSQGSWSVEFIRRLERQNRTSRKLFSAFLQDESSAKIRRLAFDSKVFLDIPSEEWSTEAHQIMRDALPAWEEMYIVLGDVRHERDKWLDIYAGFRDLSSREKREKHCAYVRSYVRTLNTHDYFSKFTTLGLEDVLLPPINYRFVSIEESGNGRK